jgi:CreA protein
VVDAFDGSQVDGVSSYLWHAKTGRYADALSLAEDPSDAYAACRQAGAMGFECKVNHEEEIDIDDALKQSFKFTLPPQPNYFNCALDGVASNACGYCLAYQLPA